MSAMPAVFATPAAMAEHGATVRRLWRRMRRLAAEAAAAVGGRTPRARTVDHAEMARRRMVAQTLEALRQGAYADAALGGPRLR
ncbi:hypothetical protein [Microbacterium timonense]|uniref:hypothetical protein n=1 Tax=Microbacterium timonense TaxID=2086576 RepID=UPI000D0E6900|nr:hypothetical protein [Microbacterium timonense]